MGMSQISNRKDYSYSFAFQDQFIVIDFIKNTFNKIVKGDKIGVYVVLKKYEHFILTLTPEGDKESFDAFDTMLLLNGKKREEVGFVYGNRSM